jgi:hypothetical protein
MFNFDEFKSGGGGAACEAHSSSWELGNHYSNYLQAEGKPWRLALRWPDAGNISFIHTALLLGPGLFFSFVIFLHRR